MGLHRGSDKVVDGTGALPGHSDGMVQAVHAIPENVAIAIGSAVGYLGTEKIKEIILAHFQKGANNENQ